MTPQATDADRETARDKAYRLVPVTLPTQTRTEIVDAIEEVLIAERLATLELPVLIKLLNYSKHASCCDYGCGRGCTCGFQNSLDNFRSLKDRLKRKK